MKFTKTQLVRVIKEELDKALGPKLAFDKVFNHVRNNGKYVKRENKTIGAGWTRDTWTLGSTTVFLEDEGYSRGIIDSDLHLVVYDSASTGPSIRKGTLEDLMNVFKRFRNF